MDYAGWRVPPWFHPDLPAAPLQQMSWLDFMDAFDQSVRPGDIVDRKIAVEGVQVQFARNLGMLQDGLELAPEIEVRSVAVVVQGLNAHAVPDQHEPFPGFGPDSCREHPAHFGKRSGIPLPEGSEYGFGITMGTEAVAQPFQLG